MHILVFDSGLGGLSVLEHITATSPHARITYVADNAGFPYGSWRQEALAERIVKLMAALIDDVAPDIVVIACNTASTIALDALRAAFPLPFVGTVPAIKLAAKMSKSRMFSVLATPGTVTRVYTAELVERYAGDCRVKLVGVRGLAGLAEAKLRGVEIKLPHLAALIAPAFVENDYGRRTDAVVLACTHYPLIMDELEQAAPWPVSFIDPAPAIARQVLRVAGEVKIKAAALPEIVFTADIGQAKALPEYLAGRNFRLPPRILPGWGRGRGVAGISG